MLLSNLFQYLMCESQNFVFDLLGERNFNLHNSDLEICQYPKDIFQNCENASDIRTPTLDKEKQQKGKPVSTSSTDPKKKKKVQIELLSSSSSVITFENGLNLTPSLPSENCTKESVDQMNYTKLKAQQLIETNFSKSEFFNS